MKLLYILAALPLLAMAAPAPVPSYRVKREENPVYSKRQLTVADLKRRAEETEDDKYHHHHKPSYPAGYHQAR